MANPVTWFEVVGQDGAKLQKFYGDLFGWKIDANNPMNYGMVEPADNGIGGGITGGAGENGATKGVTVYAEVADPDAILKKAESMGGRIIMPPMAVPNGPTIAQFTDPEGNMIGLIKAGSMGGSGG